MLLAPELTYALLLASNGASADLPAAAHLQPPLPVSESRQDRPEGDQSLPQPPSAQDAQTAPRDDSAEPESAIGTESVDPELDQTATLDPQDATGDQSDPESMEGEPIVVTGSFGTEGDPAERINAEVFGVAQEFDGAVLEPMVDVYQGFLPEPLRDGLNNFTRNLYEPVNFVNFLLQFKIGKAVETLGRFVINTTVGFGGLFDIAEDPTINLPFRRNGFANTLGYYGVEPGPYLFLPVIGSTTVRDLIGDGLDGVLLPTLVGRPFNRPEVSIPITVVRSINRRLEFEECNADIVEESNDPYAANRDIYLEQRQRDIDILRGRIPDPLPEASDGNNAIAIGADCPVPVSEYDDQIEQDDPVPSAPESVDTNAPSVSSLSPTQRDEAQPLPMQDSQSLQSGHQMAVASRFEPSGQAGSTTIEFENILLPVLPEVAISQGSQVQ